MRSDRPRRHPVTLPVALPADGSTRRRWLQRALALSAGISGTLMSSRSDAKTDKAGTAAPDKTGEADRNNDTAPPAFMQLSQTLTGKKVLNAAVGARLFNVLKKNNPDFLVRIRKLATAVHSGWPNVTKSQHLLAMKILRGWYLGVVDHTVVTYAHALMFRSVASASIPSYCNDLPLSWAKRPLEG
jgi:hypothetical protein